MRINLSSNVEEVSKNLYKFQRDQIPFAASQAINDIAYDLARNVMPDKADKTFEGGATPFTQRGFRYTKSSKRNLTAYVFANEKQNDYLKFMVYGGTRFPKKRAILVSTKHSKLNKYGNIPRGTLQNMINDKSKYFKGTPKGRTGSSFEGIWERYGRSGGGQRIRMVAKYTGDAQYRPLFPFGSFAKDVIFSQSGGFTTRFKERLAKAIASAR